MSIYGKSSSGKGLMAGGMTFEIRFVFNGSSFKQNLKKKVLKFQKAFLKSLVFRNDKVK